MRRLSSSELVLSLIWFIHGQTHKEQFLQNLHAPSVKIIVIQNPTIYFGFAPQKMLIQNDISPSYLNKSPSGSGMSKNKIPTNKIGQNSDAPSSSLKKCHHSEARYVYVSQIYKYTAPTKNTLHVQFKNVLSVFVHHFHIFEEELITIQEWHEPKILSFRNDHHSHATCMRQKETNSST